MYDVGDLYLDHGERDKQLTWLRENDPIAYDEANDLWYITRHEDVAEVSRRPETFSNANGITYFDALPLSLITIDDPEHGRLRRIVSRQFTPKMVTKLRDRTRSYTEEAIGAVAAQGEADFVEAISAPVTLKIILDMLGIPHGAMENIRRWTDNMMDSAGRLDEPGVADRAAENFVGWSEYVDGFLQDRVENPGDDLISALATSDVERLVGEELTMFATLLMVAGNETTRHTTTRGIEALHKHPEERRRLLDNPELMPTATEEILRWSSVVRGMMRTVVTDTELDGVHLPKDARLVLLYPSANRDSEAFDDPFSFRIDRDPNPQLAFGIGTHFCLGANLARMEVEVIIETVLANLPDIAIAPGAEVVGRANGLINGVASMPVVFTPTD